MKELDENKVYLLDDLTSEELNEVDNYIKSIQPEYNTITVDEYSLLEYKTYNEWCYWHKENSIKYNYETTNAKELFYTLENIQVDCRYLIEEQIKEMADVFEKSGFDMGTLSKTADFCYLNDNNNNYCLVNMSLKNKTTITYEKFMELFGKEENFKKLVEVLNEELTEEAYKETEYEVKYIAEKPNQYQIGIDTFERMEANCTKEECLAFAKGNIDKYNWRNKGQGLEDLEKIISYANWAIKQLKK